VEENNEMKNIRLPSEVEFHEEIRLLIYRPRGLLNQAAVNKIITVIGELEHSLKEPFNRFSDTVETAAVELNYEYVIRASLYRRFVYGTRPPIRSAILATDATAVHYARLLALITHGSPINVGVFQERQEAAQWLGVPLELLTEK
jgi:Flp pilus assembly pilin Flp